MSTVKFNDMLMYYFTRRKDLKVAYHSNILMVLISLLTFPHNSHKIMCCIANMGNITYKDGDPPTTYYYDPFGPGFAYYKSCNNGACKICDNLTHYWFVSTWETGYHICKACYRN